MMHWRILLESLAVGLLAVSPLLIGYGIGAAQDMIERANKKTPASPHKEPTGA